MNLIKKIYRGDLEDSTLFYGLVLLLLAGFFPDTILTKKNLPLAIISRAIMLNCWLFFIYLRLRRIGLNFSKDEIFILIFGGTAFLFSCINLNDKIIDYFQPLLLIVSFLGISSFLKIVKIDSNLIIKTLKISFLISLIHVVIMQAFSWKIIKEIIFLQPLAITEMDRAWQMKGTLDTPNTFAYQILLGLLSSIILLYKSLKNKKMFYTFLFFSLYLLILLLFTVSRSALISFVFFGGGVILALPFFLANNKIKLKKIILSLSLIFLVIFITFGLNEKYQILENIINKNQDNVSTFRISTWTSFLKDRISIFPDKKFFIGEGFHGFLEKAQKISTAPGGKDMHNIFLEIWGRYGIINLLLIIIFLGYLFMENIRLKNFYLINLLPLVLLLRNLFEADLFIGIFRWEMVFFWLTLILPYYYEKKAKT